MITKSDRFMRVLEGKPVDRTPAWIMRQAGRYLPEYREIRANVRDFIELCETPELSAEVTLQPLRRFNLDAAILFQDILTLPAAMGAPLHFAKNEGPIFDSPIRTLKDIERLKDVIPEEDMAYVDQEIHLICHELDGKLPLIGFCGSPWTVATYMVEGKLTKQFQIIRQMMYQAPEVLHGLLTKLCLNSFAYLKAQVESGVSALMIFDTWGGILPYRAFNEFSLNYMSQIIQMLKEDVVTQNTPIIVFTKQAAHRYQELAQSGARCIGTDWTMPLSWVREQVGPDIVLQGNLDPFVLYSDEKRIEQEIEQLLEDYGHRQGHIFNLGHGILPSVEPQKVQVLLDALHQISAKYHVPHCVKEG